MNNRAIVNVATGRYVTGQKRMQREFPNETLILWADQLPTYSPDHTDTPFAFKAWALKAANCQHGKEVLLWCDACIVPGKRSLEDLWRKIETDGYWISRNAFGGTSYTNYEWTADSAYRDLFPGEKDAWAENAQIQHVVATTFGLDLRTAIGKAFLDEFLRLAQTDAFKGPAINGNHYEGESGMGKNAHCYPCGPPGVRGHRWDQTAASVIAWRLGMKLTEPPEWIAYPGQETEQTCFIADGAY